MLTRFHYDDNYLKWKFLFWLMSYLMSLRGQVYDQYGSSPPGGNWVVDTVFLGSFHITHLYTQSLLLSLQPKKLGFSNLTHLRRRRPDASTDYVCPVESSLPQSGPSTVNGVQVRPYVGFRGLSPILDRESERSRDQVGVKENRPDQSPWHLWPEHGDTVLSRFFIQLISHCY